MKYVVDARFENGKPRLRVLDAETGTVHLEWSLTRVNKMLDEGEIPPEDFLHPERYGMNLLLKNLFLLSCIESFSESGDCHLFTANPVKKLPNKKTETRDSMWHFSYKMRPV